MDKILSVFIYIWVGVFVLLNLLGIAGEFYLKGFYGGLNYVQEIYSPFNVINYLFSLVCLLPAIIAYYWRNKIRDRKNQNEIS